MTPLGIDPLSKRALLLHGTDGHPEENWLPWARQRLESAAVEVDVPALPTPADHSLQHWTDAFLAQTRVRDYAICVAHSLGVSFALRLVESELAHFDVLVSVAGCVGRTNIARFDALNRSFLSAPFEWRRLRGRIGEIVIVYSDDDPYIDVAQSEQLARDLAATTIVLHSAGHINATAGYLALDAIDPFLTGLGQSGPTTGSPVR